MISRRLVLGVAAVAGLALAAFVFAVYAIPKERFIFDLRSAIEGVTGRAVTISGTPEVTLLPRPGLRVGRIVLAGSTGPGQPSAEADGAVLALSLSAIARGKISPGSVDLEGLRLVLSPDDLDWLPNSLTVEADTARLSLSSGTLAMRLTGHGTYGAQAAELSLAIADLAAMASGTWSEASLSAESVAGTFAFAGKASLLPGVNYPMLKGVSEFGLDRAPDGQLAAVFATFGPFISDLLPLSGDATLNVTPQRLAILLRANGRRGDMPVSGELYLSGAPGWDEDGPVEIEANSRGGGLYSAYLDGAVVRGEGSNLVAEVKATAIDLPTILDWLDLDAAASSAPAGQANLTAGIRSGAVGYGVTDLRLRTADGTIGGSGLLDTKLTSPMFFFRPDDRSTGAAALSRTGWLSELGARPWLDIDVSARFVASAESTAVVIQPEAAAPLVEPVASEPEPTGSEPEAPAPEPGSDSREPAPGANPVLSANSAATAETPPAAPETTPLPQPAAATAESGSDDDSPARLITVPVPLPIPAPR